MRQGRQDRATSVSGIFITIFCVLCVLWSGSVLADREPWPQYANIAPLPGAGIAIDHAGTPDGLGALQVNIPVAYTPAPNFLSIGAFAGNYSNEHNENFGNGSGFVGAGVGANPRLYFSVMQVSRHFDESKTISAQVLVSGETDRAPAISVGVQDMLKKEPHGRSLYVVATKSFADASVPVYFSLGYGGGRFLDRVFAGVSVPLGGRFNLAAEWDGFQLNTGIAWRPGGRGGPVTLLGGYNGRSGWLAGAATTVSLGRGK